MATKVDGRPATPKRKREASLYDAVAGRVGSKGFIPEFPSASKYRDTISSNTQPIAPEEVLFKRKAAPIRYEETDYYFANEKLPQDQQLPDSDLLKAIHQYSSDFYARSYGKKGAAFDYRSMDETALLAMGILLEETLAESLGENGDLAFTEPEEYSNGLPESHATRAQIHGSVPIVGSPRYVSEEASDESDFTPPVKRSKTG